MAHFYGIVKGSRGEATRCGTKASGMITKAASWQGAVEVRLYTVGHTDYAVVSLTRWRGEGTEIVLYDGPVEGTESQHFIHPSHKEAEDVRLSPSRRLSLRSSLGRSS